MCVASLRVCPVCVTTDSIYCLVILLRVFWYTECSPEQCASGVCSHQPNHPIRFEGWSADSQSACRRSGSASVLSDYNLQIYKYCIFTVRRSVVLKYSISATNSDCSQLKTHKNIQCFCKPTCLFLACERRFCFSLNFLIFLRSPNDSRH